MPFSGTWGVASSISHALAGEAASAELEQSGALDGLSKKDAKKLTSERARALSIELAEQIATDLRTQWRIRHRWKPPMDTSISPSIRWWLPPAW